jgi:hypothetical protein
MYSNNNTNHTSVTTGGITTSRARISSKCSNQSGKLNFDTSEFKAIRAKTESEVAFLEAEFIKDPTWNRKTVQVCKKALSLRTDQIYKWGYDRKKLLQKVNRREAKLSQISDLKLISAYQKELAQHGLNGLVSVLVMSIENCLVNHNHDDLKLLNSLASISNSQVSESAMDNSLGAQNTQILEISPSKAEASTPMVYDTYNTESYFSEPKSASEYLPEFEPTKIENFELMFNDDNMPVLEPSNLLDFI